MNEEIKKIKIDLPTCGSVVIQKSHADYKDPQTEGDYYVIEWKDGHYTLDDCLTECRETIDAIEHFKKKYMPVEEIPQMKGTLEERKRNTKVSRGVSPARE